MFVFINLQYECKYYGTVQGNWNSKSNGFHKRKNINIIRIWGILTRISKQHIGSNDRDNRRLHNGIAVSCVYSNPRLVLLPLATVPCCYCHEFLMCLFKYTGTYLLTRQEWYCLDFQNGMIFNSLYFHNLIYIYFFI